MVAVVTAAETAEKEQNDSRTDLYLYDFIKEDLRSLLKLKLEVLKEKRRQQTCCASKAAPFSDLQGLFLTHLKMVYLNITCISDTTKTETFFFYQRITLMNVFNLTSP